MDLPGSIALTDDADVREQYDQIERLIATRATDAQKLHADLVELTEGNDRVENGGEYCPCFVFASFYC